MAQRQGRGHSIEDMAVRRSVVTLEHLLANDRGGSQDGGEGKPTD